MSFRWSVVVVVACSSPKQNDTPAPVPVPAPVAGSVVSWKPLATDRPFLAAQVGGDRETECAISRDGRVACWGRLRPDDDGPADLRAGVATPRRLVGITGVTSVAVNWYWLCVAQAAGPGGCFSLSPDVQPPPRFPSPPVELAAFRGLVCERTRDGQIACGSQIDGKATTVASVSGATQLSCGPKGCCAIVAKGALSCFAQEGSPPNQRFVTSTPTVELPPAVSVGLTAEGGCVRTTTGATACWGDVKDRARASGVRAIFGGKRLCVVMEPDGATDCDDEALSKQSEVISTTEMCAAHTDGSVTCRGDNDRGQLGDGHTLLALAPIRVPVDDVKDLQVANSNACAIRGTDDLWCWGRSAPKSVGTTSQLLPSQYDASCHMMESHALRCDDEGELDPLVGPGAPTTLRTLAIDISPNVCAIDEAGEIHCRFTLGQDEPGDRWITVTAAKKAIAIQPLSRGFCAILEDASVGCFIDHRFDEDDRIVAPVRRMTLDLVPGVSGVTELATGTDLACVIANDTRVQCWHVGKNDVVELAALKGATSIAANDHHQCAVVRGDVWCWGDNRFGQLGNGAVTPRFTGEETPVKAKLSFKATKVGVGGRATCALDDQHHVWCWGGDGNGSLGQGRPLSSPTPLRVVSLGPR